MMVGILPSDLPKDQHGTPILNGAFAVPKPGKGGIRAQRFIASLINSNLFFKVFAPTLLPYQGQFCNFLLQDGEVLALSSEGIANCFYQFAMHPSWHKYFAFSKKVPGSVFGLSIPWV